MTYYKSITSILLISFLSLPAGVKAQVNIIQQAINKLESSDNFSYRYTRKLRQYNADTMTTYHSDAFVKAPNDKVIGYMFSMETSNKANGSKLSNVYNGKEMITIDEVDRTFETNKIKPSYFQNSLLGYLQILNGSAQRKPVKLYSDTIVNTIACNHLLITSYDTTIKNEHYFTRIDIYTDRENKVPVRVKTISRNRNTGDVIINYFYSVDYTDFLFNQNGIDFASYKVPTGYRPMIKKEILPLLKPGVTAPEWNLSDVNGKKLNLSDLKGKVVLLDFFFIGCEGGMVSLKPLNNLYRKYEKKGFTIVGISDIDTKKSMNVFKVNNDIPYHMFGDAREPFSNYHIPGSPTFYFIDKEGIVAEAIVGYENDFEQKATATIDKLLNK